MNAKENTIAFLTLVKKETRRFIRIWPQTLLQPIIIFLLYIFIFHNLNQAISDQKTTTSYLHFIAPGLIMMGVINSSCTNASLSLFSAYFRKNIEEVLVSSMSVHLILLGYITASMLRGLWVGFFLIIITMLMLNLHIHHMFFLIYSVVFSSFIFSIIGLLVAIRATDFDDLNFIPTYFITPLIYLGGIFYPVKWLSDFGYSLSFMNPVFYIIDLFRYSFLDRFETNIEITIAIFPIVSFLLYRCVYFIFSNKLNH